MKALALTHHKLPALAAALVLTLAFVSARPAHAASQSASSALRATSAFRLDHSLAATLARNGSVDAIVTFRNGAILREARLVGRTAALPAPAVGTPRQTLALRERIGTTAAISMLGTRYAGLKRRVFARAGSGIQVRRSFANLPSALVRFRSAAALLAVARSPEVLSVGAPLTYRLTDTSPNLTMIHADQMQASGYSGAGTFVAVLDTGADYTRSAFGSCTAPNAPTTCGIFFSKEYDALHQGQDGTPDDDGHGTNVSGIVEAVAPGTKIFALDVFTQGTDGLEADDANTEAALNDVVTWKKQGYNIRAVNMSFGAGGSHYTSACTTDPDGNANPMAPLFAQLRTLNVLPVVAAGNDASVDDSYVDGVAYPACTAGAVGVGAVYADDYYGPQGFGQDPNTCWDLTAAQDQPVCFSQSSPTLGLLAPGAYITAAGITEQGTSQATPHVAGAAAVLAAARPSATAAQIETALETTGPAIADDRFGGRVKHRLDLTAALAALPAADTTPPLVSSVGRLIPSVVTTPGTAVDTSGRVPVKVTWTASDSGGSGLAGYDVDLSTNGTWTVLSSPGVATSTTVPLAPGSNSYRFAIRAHDGAGNASDWAYSAPFTLTTYQETSGSIVYGGTWAQTAWSPAWGGYEKTSGTAGGTAKLTFSGTDVAWIAPMATNRGQAAISIDGSVVRTVDLYSATTIARAVGVSYYWASSGTHTIQVKDVGTSGRPTIDVDAFVVMS